MVSHTFYPNLPTFLHRYICHICDISQLCDDDGGGGYDDDNGLDVEQYDDQDGLTTETAPGMISEELGVLHCSLA